MSKELEGSDSQGEADMEMESEDEWQVVTKGRDRSADCVVKDEAEEAECVDELTDSEVRRDSCVMALKQLPLPPTSPTQSRSNISISHIDLLYQATPEKMICRMCL